MTIATARKIVTFPVTIPAGTPVASPQVSNVSFPTATVLEIDIRVPPGPRGEVGFSLGSSGVHVLPEGAAAWIITDDEKLNWPVYGQWDSGAWTVVAYNTGQYPHTLYFTFHLDVVQAQPQARNFANPGALSAPASG